MAANPPRTYKTILVPLDGSTLAETALVHAQALATQMHSSLVLLRVSAYPSYDFLFVDPLLAATLRQDVEQIHDEERRYLRETAAGLKKAGLRVSADLREGDPAEAILETAASSHADLIVMTTHGRGGLSRWLMGSVADRIVHHASIPVLLIRAGPTVVSEAE
jgi:nucleotide-binding universal stress UspA family protein